jgi:hypothetical protein
MTQTEYLKLSTYDTSESGTLNTTIYDFINQTSGSSSTENLGRIDAFATKVSASLVSFSGCMTSIDNSLTNLNSSVAGLQDSIKSVVIQVTGSSTVINQGLNFHLRIPSEINNYYLYRSKSFLNSAADGTSGCIIVQLRNTSLGLGTDNMLSTPMLIVNGSVVGNLGVTGSSGSYVRTDDNVRILVEGVSGSILTPAAGLQVVLEFKPL